MLSILRRLRAAPRLCRGSAPETPRVTGDQCILASKPAMPKLQHLLQSCAQPPPNTHQCRWGRSKPPASCAAACGGLHRIRSLSPEAGSCASSSSWPTRTEGGAGSCGAFTLAVAAVCCVVQGTPGASCRCEPTDDDSYGHGTKK